MMKNNLMTRVIHGKSQASRSNSLFYSSGIKPTDTPNQDTPIDSLNTQEQIRIDTLLTEIRKTNPPLEIEQISTFTEDKLKLSALEWKEQIDEHRLPSVLSDVIYAFADCKLFEKPYYGGNFDTRMWIRSFLAISMNESRWQPSVVNMELNTNGTRKSDAYGLVQLISDTWNYNIDVTAKSSIKMKSWLIGSTMRTYARKKNLVYGTLIYPIGKNKPSADPRYQLVPIIAHFRSISNQIEKDFSFSDERGWEMTDVKNRTNEKWLDIYNEFSQVFKDKWLGRHLLILLITAEGGGVFNYKPLKWFHRERYAAWVIRFEASKTSAREYVDKFINRSIVTSSPAFGDVVPGMLFLGDPEDSDLDQEYIAANTYVRNFHNPRKIY